MLVKPSRATPFPSVPFIKPAVDNCRRYRQPIEDYAEASGQQVNVEKSMFWYMDSSCIMVLRRPQILQIYFTEFGAIWCGTYFVTS